MAFEGALRDFASGPPGDRFPFYLICIPHPSSSKHTTRPKRHCQPPATNEMVYSFDAPHLIHETRPLPAFYVTNSAVAVEAWLILASEVPGTINSSGAFSSTNFLSLTCSFELSAVQTLSSNFPRFWPSTCLNIQVGFRHGLNLHTTLLCVNLQFGVVQSAPLRHGGMLGCLKGQRELVQLG